ncbi:hypothetical protein [Shewanella cyperi]|uniref:hypothetical protein n=1 Tax=Shewanella cyperi TaxID=2814292 RepID=UPI001A94C69C|nr:hypothetical protein [Shewanella cyperi]QSX40464.1 hypothetical protein JYB84_16130 [Shewanella cyperi]
MQPQREVEGELMGVFRTLTALILLLLILGGLGWRYFSGLESVAGNGLALQHSRLLNVLGMARSQWLSQGQPGEVMLQWAGDGGRSVVKMSKGGWPVPDEASADGCARLWQALLSVKPESGLVSTDYSVEADICSFTTHDGDRLEYSLLSGKLLLASQE